MDLVQVIRQCEDAALRERLLSALHTLFERDRKLLDLSATEGSVAISPGALSPARRLSFSTRDSRAELGVTERSALTRQKRERRRLCHGGRSPH